MERRTFMSSVAGALAAQVSGAQVVRAPARAPAPNIVYIMADDLGYFDLGCYGQEHIKTPNIDRLAAEGMRFTHCYSGATVCAPARSTLMTGLHTGHTTVRSNLSVRTGRRVSLQADDFTIAEMLKGSEWVDAFDEERAYVTGMFGKWGLGEPGSPGLPNDHGFDEWFGYLNQQHAHSHYPEYLWRNKRKETLHGNVDGQRREYSSDLFTREALYFIDRHRYQRFFLYLPYTVPHARNEVPSLEPYTGEPWSEQEKTYAAMVTRLDSYVGQVVAKLKETGLEEDTLIFFASDNGGTSGSSARFGGNRHLNGRKGSVYEGGIRVPMIARWPGRITAGSVSNYPWAFWDLMPTIAELVGTRSLRDSDGVSVAPVLFGQSPRVEERTLYWENYDGRGFSQAARIGNWKGVRHGLKEPLELYDLSTDEGETKNVASANPHVVQRMEEYLAQSRTDSLEYPAS